MSTNSGPAAGGGFGPVAAGAFTVRLVDSEPDWRGAVAEVVASGRGWGKGAEWMNVGLAELPRKMGEVLAEVPVGMAVARLELYVHVGGEVRLGHRDRGESGRVLGQLTSPAGPG